MHPVLAALQSDNSVVCFLKERSDGDYNRFAFSINNSSTEIILLFKEVEH